MEMMLGEVVRQGFVMYDVRELEDRLVIVVVHG